MTSRPTVRPDLAVMKGYHSPQVDVEVRLNTNESPISPPAEFCDAVAHAVARLDWHRYPDREASALRAAIADHHDVEPEQVFAANGSNEVLQTLLLAYGGPDRSALTFEPTYALHGHIARITGTRHVVVDRAADFSLDPATVTAAIDEHRPEVTFLCSPNNPTGMVENSEALSAAMVAAESSGGLLVVDEAYGQFAPSSALELVADDRNLVVTRTFSKTWSMAAARLGYAIAPRWLVSELETAVLPYHLDAVTQLAGTIALRHADAMRTRVATLVEERGRVVTALSELDVDVWPSNANFVLFRPRHRDGGDVWQALLDRSVLVRNCASWPRLGGCLRVTIGTPHEDDRFLQALSDALSEVPT